MSTDRLAKRIPKTLRLFKKKLRVVRSRQALEERSHRRRQSIVDFVAGSPECIAACGGKGVNFQHCVVGRDRLERNVCVPCCRCEATYVGELVCEAAAFLLLFAAYDGYLVAEFGAFFSEGMDVEVGC